jgi:hypothetical protein
MSVRTVLPNGDIEWRLDGLYHNDNGPAVIGSDGTLQWWLNGDLHRNGAPAFISDSGTKVWFVRGKRHRVGGPAFIYANGTQVWFINDKMYREPHNGKPMPVIVKKDSISYDGKTFIPITEEEYEKYKYYPPGRFTKSARP